MRLLETQPLAGCVLVSACHTDLGDAGERASGYYPPSGGPWRFRAMMRNANGRIRVLHSDNDPFIPLSEAQHVAAQLGPPCELSTPSPFEPEALDASSRSHGLLMVSASICGGAAVVRGASHFFSEHEEIYEAVIAVAEEVRAAQGELT